ncbi:hypothetical protein ACFPM7_05835 [Actinokineospora guangxiensis]|uniref:DinB family protein n=1 Tax=Actinokineospora guangxiensis TaxID=1490288 RepID=A0ABW0ELW2_9PSEU
MHPSPRSWDSLPDPDAYGVRQLREFLDPWHPRASIESGRIEETVVDPQRVLDNVVMALHRLDIDLDSPSVLDPATITTAELAAMLDGDRAPQLIAHVLNTAVRLMASRYPGPAARDPFSHQYDLRHLTPPAVDGDELALARDLFNRRLAAHDDMAPADLAADLAPYDPGGLVRVLAAISVLYCHKLVVLKYYEDVPGDDPPRPGARGPA